VPGIAARGLPTKLISFFFETGSRSGDLEGAHYRAGKRWLQTWGGLIQRLPSTLALG
jgi:hypothetical protein